MIDLGGGIIGLRHAHNTANPVLRLTAGEWRAFMAKARGGAFDAVPAA